MFPVNSNEEIDKDENISNRLFFKKLVNGIEKMIAKGLPLTALTFSLIYFGTACFVYKYPSIEDIVLCPWTK